MAKISDSKPKNSSDGYTRLFGNDELGKLITKIQSAVISSGNELERMINALLKEKGQIINDLDAFLDDKIIRLNDFGVVPKSALKKSKAIDFPTQEPDFVILKMENTTRHCYIIELKDGHVFDTKKSAGEKNSLQKFESYVATKLPYTTSIHICSFNQLDKKLIMAGFKNKFSEDEILNGQEFCDILSINYNDIISIRLQHQKENLEYFVNEILKISEVKNLIAKNL